MVEQSVDAVLDAYQTITAGMPAVPPSFIQLDDDIENRPYDYTVLQMIDGSLVSVAVDEVDDNKTDEEIGALA